MNLLVLDLPLEIQESVFLLLDAVSLISATKACCLWWEIGQKCLQQKCLREIPEDILEELQENVEDLDDVDWSAIYWQWLEAEICPRSENLHVRSLKLNTQPSCLAVHGDIMYIGCAGMVRVYHSSSNAVQREESETPEYSHITSADIEDGPVHHLGIMGSKKLLLVTGASSLHFFKVDSPTASLWQQLNVDITVPVDSKNFSVFRNCFTVSPQAQLLSMYAVSEVEQQTLTVKHITDIETPSWLFLWKMWKDKVTCLLTTGEICIWDLPNRTWQYISEPYPEVRYQNPCWIFRDVIFCSTLTSRSLLAYWHMDRGVYYWLVGWSDSSIPLRRWYPGQGIGDGEDVLCVALRRQLLVCGTYSGKLLVYKIQDLASWRDIHSYSDLESELELPIVIISASEHPIKFVDFSFFNTKIYFFIRTKKNIIECIQSSTLLSLEKSAKTIKEAMSEAPL